MYEYDGNAILVEPMKSRTAQEHTRAYQAAYERLAKRGFKPQLQRLDNEASSLLMDFMEDKGVDFQLTPAGSH